MHKSIGIDVDDVTAKFLKKISWRYNQIHSNNKITVNDFTSFNCYECPSIKYPDTIVNTLFHEESFYDEGVEKFENSREVIEALQKNFEIFFVSNAVSYPVNMISKFNWIRRNFPTIDYKHIIYTYDKSVIDVDFLIDDSSKNLENIKGLPILFNSSHNQNDNRFHRCYNWDDIFKFFQGF